MKSRLTDKPEPGHYKMRLTRGGPWVGAKITHGPGLDPETGEVLDRSYLWEVTINGEVKLDPSPDPVAAGVMKVWLYGLVITEAQYDYLVKSNDWDAKYAPGSPGANPTRPMDLGAIASNRFEP